MQSRPIYLITLVFLVIAGFLAGTYLSKQYFLPPLSDSSYPSLFSSPSPSPIAPPLTTLTFVGDIMLGRSVNLGSLKRGDFSWPFQLVNEKLSRADLTIGNLESILYPDCPPVDTGFKFCADPQALTGLLLAGFDVLSLANNHTTNYGQEGISYTNNLLTNNGIQVVGLGEPVVINRHGTRFGFLAYNQVGVYQGIATATEDRLVSDLIILDNLADVKVIIFHWGTEYVATPSATQIKLARLAVDHGADLVVGAHPHWVQTNERYQGKPIYYSLGNFIFDQEWSQQTKQGLALTLSYQGPDLIKVDESPVLIKDYGQATWQ